MKLLKVKEVAKVLGVNPSYVYELMKKGHLNYLIMGSKKVTDFELERFLKEAQGKDFSNLDNVVSLETQQNKN